MNKLTIGQPSNMFVHALASTVTFKVGYVTYHIKKRTLLNVDTLIEWSYFINDFFYDHRLGVTTQ